MTIVDKIIASIHAALNVVPDDPDEEVQVFPVYYHDEPTLNLLTGDMEFPCALFQLLTTGDVAQEGGQAKERVSAAVFFVEKSDFDFDAIDNETNIDRCKGRAFKWMLSLPAGQYVTLERINRTNRIYDTYDDILTGYGLFVDLVEQEGVCE